MKKIFVCSILVSYMLTLFSCGTSDTEKSTYEQNAKKFLSENIVDTARTVKPQNVSSNDAPLVFIGEVEITAFINGFDPKKVFSTDDDDAPIANFYHGSNFESLLYDHALPVSPQRAFKLKIYKTTRVVTDYEIQSFTKQTPLSTSEFYHALAYLISNQSNGEIGKLSTNFQWNIFHVQKKNEAPVAVCVRWDSVDGVWDLHARVFDSWNGGCLVFSRGN